MLCLKVKKEAKLEECAVPWSGDTISICDKLDSLLNPQFISKPAKEKSMKCIKRGTVPPERIWQGECHNCNSVFEAKEREVEKIFIDPRENAGMSKALCEVCNNYFWLYPK